MSDVPKIRFHPANPVGDSIELIDLGELYGRKDRMDHQPEQPHRVSFHMLIHIRHGNGEHFIDFQRYPYSDGSFIFVSKGQVHAFDFSQRPEGVAVLFTDAFIERLQTNMRTPWGLPSPPVFKPDTDLEGRCSRLLADIRHEASEPESSMLIIMFLFSSVLLMLMRAARKQESHEPSDRNRKNFSKFQALLEAGYTQTRDAADYAAKMYVTYKTLNQICKNNTGKTAKQIIDEYVVLEAKRRLVLEQVSVQSLAFELGFDDTSNFVKYFSRHTGGTPAHFRRESCLNVG